MKHGNKKGLSFVLLVLLLTISIVGCNKAPNEKAKSSNKATGRYVEEEVILPEEASTEEYFQLEKDEKGTLILYSLNKSKDKIGVYEYTQASNGEWKKKYLTWTEQSYDGIPFSYKILTGPTKEQYFYSVVDKDGWGVHSVIKAIDDKKNEKVFMQGWDPNENQEESSNKPGCISNLEFIDILENGNLICGYTNDEIYVYDKDSYEIIAQKRVKSNHIIPLEDQFMYLSNFNEEGNYPSSVSFCSNTLESIEDITFDGKESTCETLLCSGKDELIVLSNEQGIHTLLPKTKLWETVVDGSLTSLSQPSLWPKDMIATDDSVFYILYGGMTSECSLMKYVYDKTVPTTPEKELSIYALEDHASIREAIHLFQRNNPNVRINFRVALDQQKDVNKDDYIKALNTELLSGNGPDLIVLDDLPLDAYVEKGGLKDISDIINPLLENGSLLPNIIEPYKTGEKIYCVPTRYTLSMMYGKPEIIAHADTLDNLLKYVKTTQGSTFFGKISYEDLVKQFLPAVMPSLLDENSNIKEGTMKTFLEQIHTIGKATNALAIPGEEYRRKPGIYELASEVDMTLETTSSLYEGAFGISILYYMKGGLIPYENAFTPVTQIGINEMSKQVELAKQFIETLLSEDIQKVDFYDGFPVNAKALEHLEHNSDKDYRAQADIQNADGSYSPLYVIYPKEEERSLLVESCKAASKKTVNNEVLTKAIIEEGLPYFEGTITSDGATKAIISKAKIYLTE